MYTHISTGIVGIRADSHTLSCKQVSGWHALSTLSERYSAFVAVVSTWHTDIGEHNVASGAD